MRSDAADILKIGGADREVHAVGRTILVSSAGGESVLVAQMGAFENELAAQSASIAIAPSFRALALDVVRAEQVLVQSSVGSDGIPEAGSQKRQWTLVRDGHVWLCRQMDPFSLSGRGP